MSHIQAQLVGRLNSPFLARLVDAFLHVIAEKNERWLCLVFEADCTQTLSDRNFTTSVAHLCHVQVARGIIVSVLLGLSCLHNLGIIHGEVTPANIFVDDDLKATLGPCSFALRESSFTDAAEMHATAPVV